MRAPIRASIAISYEHQIHFTRGVFRPDNLLLKQILTARASPLPPRALFVLDGNVAAAQPQLAASMDAFFSAHQGAIRNVGAPVVVSGGEAAKNSEVALRQIYAAIEEHRLCRHSYVIAVGGGALLDVAGFAAATAHRGMRHVRIPTTVLSQDDGGVGIKNGINAFGKKNFIGTFAPPLAVINDFDLLASLPDRQKRAGYIEAIKVALIRDRTFFEFIEANVDRLRQFDPAAMEELIYRCADAHVRHIATGGDPFELGSARPLDFGHWVAHKLEQLSNFRIHHGEAVAIGIAVDVIYSQRAKYLDPQKAERILDLIASLGFQLYCDELQAKDGDGQLSILKGLEEFREHLGGLLAITLLRDIGQGFEVNEMDPARIREAIDALSGHSR